MRCGRLRDRVLSGLFLLGLVAPLSMTWTRHDAKKATIENRRLTPLSRSGNE